MSLGKRTRIFLLIKIGVIYILICLSSINAAENSKVNPFVREFGSFNEKHEGRPTIIVTRPTEHGNVNDIEMSDSEIENSIFISKDILKKMDDIKNGKPTDNLSISSASTFSYGFDSNEDNEDKDLQGEKNLDGKKSLDEKQEDGTKDDKAEKGEQDLNKNDEEKIKPGGILSGINIDDDIGDRHGSETRINEGSGTGISDLDLDISNKKFMGKSPFECSMEQVDEETNKTSDETEQIEDRDEKKEKKKIKLGCLPDFSKFMRKKPDKKGTPVKGKSDSKTDKRIKKNKLEDKSLKLEGDIEGKAGENKKGDEKRREEIIIEEGESKKRSKEIKHRKEGKKVVKKDTEDKKELYSVPSDLDEGTDQGDEESGAEASAELSESFSGTKKGEKKMPRLESKKEVFLTVDEPHVLNLKNKCYIKFSDDKPKISGIANKLVQEYDSSDDEVKEYSVFDKVKNKILKKKKEEERKKKRNKGFPARVNSLIQKSMEEKEEHSDLKKGKRKPRFELKSESGEEESSGMKTYRSSSTNLHPELNYSFSSIPESSSVAHSRSDRHLSLISGTSLFSGLEKSLSSGSTSRKEMRSKSREKTEYSTHGYKPEKHTQSRSSSKSTLDPAKEIQELRDKLFLSGLLEKKIKDGQLGEEGTPAFPIQNSMEAILLKDELKKLKNAKDDYIRYAYSSSQKESNQKKEMEEKFRSHITEKEALQLELEQLSKELNKLSKEISKRQKNEDFKTSLRTRDQATSPILELNRDNDSEMSGEMDGEEVSKRDWDGKNEKSEEGEQTVSGVEESLLLDDDAEIFGMESNALQTGRVVLDPENENYGRYYEEEEASKKGEDTGLIPVIERYDDMRGVEPVVLEKLVDDSYLDLEEGLLPVEGVVPRIDDLQAFEEEGRSLLPPLEESQAIQFEEAYLARHPELINTDNIHGVKDKEIKKAFEKRSSKDVVIDHKKNKAKKEFEFVNFNMNKNEIERLKR
ncbi:signal peptide containing protein [Cryptosporidium ryanae]|uniref:signal peptide containing protein n=1 Tax=Cryptosporidium ryanae TaxID=515981 RepID=UPI00351A1A59|nr:signal peptide containing protein [Cryptosporidium ryanae]